MFRAVGAQLRREGNGAAFDYGSLARSLEDMPEVGSQSVGDVQHRVDSGGPCQRHAFLHPGQGAAVAGSEIPVVRMPCAAVEQHAQPEGRVSEAAGHADEVALPRRAAPERPARGDTACHRDIYAYPAGAGGRVAAEQGAGEPFGKLPVSRDEALQPADVRSLGYGYRQKGAVRTAAHGRDVAQVDCGGLPAEILRTYPVPDEMAAFHEHVRAYQRVEALPLGDDGAVVPDSGNAFRNLELPAYQVDKSEFTYVAESLVHMRKTNKKGSPNA